MSETYYVLDAEDRITRVVGSLKTRLGSLVGHSIWEVLPQAEPLFSPHIARARETGAEVEFTAFWGGRLSHRRLVPSGDALTVFVTELCELDVTSLATLTASLRAIEAELADRACEQRGSRAPGSLRAPP